MSETAMASTVIRVKRRITDEPFDKFVLNCKRQKTSQDVTVADEIGAKPAGQIVADPVEDTKTILKLAATVSADDDLKTHLLRLRKCDAEELVRKIHKPANVMNKLREQLKDDAQNSRFKVVNCFRSIENDASGDEQSNANGSGGGGGVSNRNITVVDVIKEDSGSSTKAADPGDRNDKVAANPSVSDNNDDRFVYDLYLVQSGQPPTEFDVSNYTIRPFDDVVYQANDETLNGSDYDSEDSNDEANWRNDYPDTDDDLSIGEEDMRRAVEDMHFSSEKESSDEEDYNYGEEPVVHFMAEQSEETEYNYFKKHGHIRNHAAYYRSKQQNRQNLGAHDTDDDDDGGGSSDSDYNDNNSSSRSSVSSVSPLASCDENDD